MQDFADSSLLGPFVKALRTDIEHAVSDGSLACLPIMACTGEKDTALGRCKGAVSLRNLDEFKTSLDAMVTENMLKVILDLASATLSRSAIGALVAFAATMHGRNKRLYLYRPSAQIRAALAELGLTDFFSYLESEDDILATLVV